MTAKYVSYTFAPRTLLGTRTLLGSRRVRRHHCQPPARSAASATPPAVTGVVEVIHLDSEDSSVPDLKEAMARSLDSFQAEFAQQRKEDADSF